MIDVFAERTGTMVGGPTRDASGMVTFHVKVGKEVVIAKCVAVVAVTVSTVALPNLAAACGSSGPDGVSACSLAEHDEAERSRWRLGVSAVSTSTTIHFSSALQTGETRYAGLAEVAYAPTARLMFNAGLGAAVGGHLLAPNGPHDFAPGFVSSLGVSYRFLEGNTPIGRGFVLASGLMSLTSSSTQLDSQGPRSDYDALDFRAGLVGGLTWWRTLSAYAVVRAFGGPVFWRYEGESQLGTDTHHYQVGGGFAVLVLRRVDMFVEGVPLGEQALEGGVSVAF
jgi:hypothetical protein